jgi:hypothetical protein
MKYTATHILCLSVWALSLFISFESAAQSNPYYSVSFRDSLEKDPASDFIYNNISITNVYLKPITINVAVNMPEGWRLLGNQQSLMDIAPGETAVFPIVLSKLPSTLAQWMPVDVAIQLKNAPMPQQYTFFVKAKVRSGYLATALDKSIELTDYQSEIPIRLLLKNKGNTDQHFKVQLSNYSFGLDETVVLAVPPTKDTDYTYTLHLTRDQWKRLDAEMVKIWISNDSGKRYYFNYAIKRLHSKVDEHQSAYATIPLGVEAGAYVFGNQLSYYGAVTGAVKLSDSSNLSYYYHSKVYGIYGFQPQQYLVTYTNRGFQAAVGNVGVSDPQFYNAGHGLKLSYMWANGNYVSVCGIMHYADTFYSSDNVSAMVHYHVGRKLWIDNTVATNFDYTNKVNSYIEMNQIQLVGIKNFNVVARIGAGFDHSTLGLKNNPNDIIGKSLSYNAGYTLKHIALLSSLTYNDNNYPGINKGYRSQYHQLNYNWSHQFIGLFYQSNYMNANYFRDSIYITNTTLYNMRNYGFHAGWAANQMSVVVGTGILQQTGLPNTPPMYQSFSIDYVYTKRPFNIQLSALAGIPFLVGTSSNYNPDIITFRGIIAHTYGGIQAYYSRIPVTTNQTGVPNADNKPYSESFNYGPYLTLNLFHHRLSTRIQYNESIMSGGVHTSNLAASIAYDNPAKGFGFSVGGYSQLGVGGATQSYGASVRKTFNVPLVNHRKYYDYTIVIFNDENANGVQDEGEGRLRGVVVYINNRPFCSDENGEVIYGNIEKGTYKIDFSKGKGAKGLMPSAGDIQVVNVDGTTTSHIAFKKGNVIAGKVIYTADSFSKAQVTMDNIKIIVTDSTGKIYTTLTDDKGEYYLNLPATIYKVSLDAGAFDETVKPKQLSYNVNLVTNAEADVVFEVVKKQREVTIRNVEL